MTLSVTDIYLDRDLRLSACPVHAGGKRLLKLDGGILIADPDGWDDILLDWAERLRRSYAYEVWFHEDLRAAVKAGSLPGMVLSRKPPEHPRTPPALEKIKFYEWDHSCAYCGVPYGRWHASIRYCSTKCRDDATRRMAADNARRRRSAGRTADHTCGHCGGSFQPKRTDARFCSGRCRVAFHRSHKESP